MKRPFTLIILSFLLLQVTCPGLNTFAGNWPPAEPGASATEPRDSLESKVDALFADIDDEYTPGAAVLVVKHGQVLLKKGYGMANLEHKVPVTSETVFDVASVSKQFTGMAIAMLVEEGAISLQDDIRKYLPELPRFDHPITVGHLVHHTSGLRDWPATLALGGWRMDDIITFDQILRMACHQQDLNFRPGSRYSYSNTGYNLLAGLVERISGKTFREWTQEHIFGPLGMDHTHFHDQHSEVVAGKAYGYTSDGDGKYEAVANGLTALGSSSLFTSIDDMAKWVTNFETHQVGGIEVWKRMLQREPLNDGGANSYAFGLVVGTHRGLRTINHSGGWAAFSTFLLHFPDQALSVVVLMNNPSNAGGAAYSIADLYLAGELEPKHSPRPDEKPSLPRPVSLPVEQLDRYTGTYRLGPAWYVTIAREGDHLTSHATGEGAVSMTPLTDTSFRVDAYGGASITFIRDTKGEVTAFRYRGKTRPRVESSPLPDSTALQAFTGTYYSEELGTRYRLVVEDGRLKALHRRHGKIDLIPAWKNEFRGGTWFMQSVEFLRENNGEISGFLVSQPRSLNQRFDKM